MKRILALIVLLCILALTTFTSITDAAHPGKQAHSALMPIGKIAIICPALIGGKNYAYTDRRSSLDPFLNSNRTSDRTIIGSVDKYVPA